MSPLDSADAGRGVYVQKPKSNIYTAMLAISLAAILIAIVFLYLEMREYDFAIKAPTSVRVEFDQPGTPARLLIAGQSAWTDGSASSSRLIF